MAVLTRMAMGMPMSHEAYWDADNCPGSLVGNATEWLDEDRDCLGSNTDYDDREFNVQTIEDCCERNENESVCAQLNQPVYLPIDDTSESESNDIGAADSQFCSLWELVLHSL